MTENTADKAHSELAETPCRGDALRNAGLRCSIWVRPKVARLHRDLFSERMEVCITQGMASEIARKAPGHSVHVVTV